MKLFLIAVIIVLAMVLSGCGQGAKIAAKITGYSMHCIDAVEYIQFTNGATVKYNTDGTISTCAKG
jgi:hypothetical protein